MVLHASILSESEISITVLYLLCSPRYTAVRTENYVCIQNSHYEKYDSAACPSYHLKLKYPLPFSVIQQYKSRTV